MKTANDYYLFKEKDKNIQYNKPLDFYKNLMVYFVLRTVNIIDIHIAICYYI